MCITHARRDSLSSRGSNTGLLPYQTITITFMINQSWKPMPQTFISIKSVGFPAQVSKSNSSNRHTSWWGPIWRGLFVDPQGKHYRAIGRALWLYGYLIIHADRRTGILYRAVSTVACDMHVSERTIQAWLALLRRHGYIRTRTTGRALVIEIEKWRPIIKADGVSRRPPL